MAYWLIYNRCANCKNDVCFKCTHRARGLSLEIIEADEAARPVHSLNGPRHSLDDVLKYIQESFSFDEETGLSFLKDGIQDESDHD